ncbi:MAG TPA: hypothetical protein VMN04_09105, partial [Thermoanaerobaculia bacterium]|nr:hypothetical protein [Thermoanaerobaculia bacterium]
MASRDRARRRTLVIPLLAAACAPAGSPSRTPARAQAGDVARPGAPPPSFAMPEGIGPRRFRVIGPFPNAPADPPGARPGLDHDYLAGLGGEATARIEPETTASFGGKSVGARDVDLDGAGVLDFKRTFGRGADAMTAYAYAEWDVEAPGRALAVFGSDDGAKVWVNGGLVHRAGLDRGLVPDADTFAVALAPGKNRVLVKVDNGDGAWAFALRILDARDRERFASFEARRHLESIAPAPVDSGYLLDETFPDLAWENPSTAAAVFEDEAPRVRWYGPDLEPAERPAAMGQYTAVVEARTRDGYTLRSMLAFAKVPPDVVPR